LLTDLSIKEKLALSTLKFNSRVLKELGLIDFNGSVKLTDFGVHVLNILENNTIAKYRGGESNGKH